MSYLMGLTSASQKAMFLSPLERHKEKFKDNTDHAMATTYLWSQPHQTAPCWTKQLLGHQPWHDGTSWGILAATTAWWVWPNAQYILSRLKEAQGGSSSHISWGPGTLQKEKMLHARKGELEYWVSSLSSSQASVYSPSPSKCTILIHLRNLIYFFI